MYIIPTYIYICVCVYYMVYILYTHMFCNVYISCVRAYQFL
jgi:hypothetical protein